MQIFLLPFHLLYVVSNVSNSVGVPPFVFLLWYVIVSVMSNSNIVVMLQMEDG